jgi:hypothetical protein
MMKTNFFFLTLLFTIGLSISSCTKEKDPEPIEAITVELSAAASPFGPYALFSFEKGGSVSASEMPTSNWDLGMRLTTMIVNSGSSGTGDAGVIIQNGIFDKISEAPESGYLTDEVGNLAVKDAAWYDYNPVTHTFAPKAGVVFIFRTAKGNYAKMEVIKADPTDDQGNIVVPPTVPTKIRYTLRYVYQEDGSRKF